MNSVCFHLSENVDYPSFLKKFLLDIFNSGLVLFSFSTFKIFLRFFKFVMCLGVTFFVYCALSTLNL